MILREMALEIARGEIGNQEIPKNSNNGPHVKKYLAAVGLQPPQYWCLAFVMWCFKEAAGRMGVKFPLKPGGHCMTFYRWVKQTHPEWLHYSGPMPGDIFIMQFKNDTGHAGIVLQVHDQHIETIEGNSNDEGSRDGYEVAHRTGNLCRTISTIKAFIRIP